MDGEDLFDVFDEAPANAPPVIQTEPNSKKETSKKRQASEEPKENGEEKQAKKEKKTDTKKDEKTKAKQDITPVVFDAVEIEASREVAVSDGLMGKTSDAKPGQLQLRHQVRRCYST